MYKEGEEIILSFFFGFLKNSVSENFLVFGIFINFGRRNIFSLGFGNEKQKQEWYFCGQFSQRIRKPADYS